MKSVPIILLTGFLGSGKTTFINWIITQYPDKKMSVIVNEFGSIKLESKFIKNKSGDVMELANGCMCCMAKSDIPRTIRLILEHSPHTEYILIEASGLSDPDPIKETLSSESLAPHVFLDTTICIIDTIHFPSTYMEHPLILSQAADSDVMILSKIGSHSKDSKAKTVRVLTANIPNTPRIEWVDTMSLEAVLTHSSCEIVRSSHHHLHEKYEQHWYNNSKPIDREKLKSIFQSLSSKVYRAKGTVQWTDGSAALLSYVNGDLTFESIESPESTTILFLSKSKLPPDFDSRF